MSKVNVQCCVIAIETKPKWDHFDLEITLRQLTPVTSIDSTSEIFSYIQFTALLNPENLKLWNNAFIKKAIISVSLEISGEVKL